MTGSDDNIKVCSLLLMEFFLISCDDANMLLCTLQVIVRFRPLNKTEHANAGGGKMCISDISGSSVSITSDAGGQHGFAFDRVFTTTSSQLEVSFSLLMIFDIILSFSSLGYFLLLRNMCHGHFKFLPSCRSSNALRVHL